MLGLALAIDKAASFSAIASFTPASLSPAVWYDPSDLTTLFQDTAGTTPITTAGQGVARINDKSGNGLHLTQATAANAPTYQVDGNGKPYLLFDGVNDYLSSASSVAGNTQSIVTAVAATSTTAGATLLNMDVSSTDRLLIRALNIAAGFIGGWNNGTTTTGKSATGSPTPNVLTVEVDKTAPSVGLRANAVASSTVASGATPGATLGTFLGSSNGTALFFAGNFYGLVQLARAFAGTERASLETYLGAKCGVAL